MSTITSTDARTTRLGLVGFGVSALAAALITTLSLISLVLATIGVALGGYALSRREPKGFAVTAMVIGFAVLVLIGLEVTGVLPRLMGR